jgi:dipeptidyl aminopeptidase/acylaminoacyl peptidase
VGGSPSLGFELVAVDLELKKFFNLKKNEAPPISEEFISQPQSITFPTSNNQVAYGYYYPPKNPNFSGPPNALPPLRVLSHGGPTASCGNIFSVGILYWTSRGFAVMNVNYGGSTGYGREFRNRLAKKWGIVDVDDCCNAALYLVDQKLVDRNKLCIQGGSAGGFTTLACLAFRPDVFKVGCSLYGVADLELLAKDTHKFESRYLDGLVGPYPEAKSIYEERSPKSRPEAISCPCIFFQGSADRVVPPQQSEVMVETLKNKGIPVSYVLYEGEGHGFRVAENVKRTHGK